MGFCVNIPPTVLLRTLSFCVVITPAPVVLTPGRRVAVAQISAALVGAPVSIYYLFFLSLSVVLPGAAGHRRVAGSDIETLKRECIATSHISAP